MGRGGPKDGTGGTKGWDGGTKGWDGGDQKRCAVVDKDACFYSGM